MFRVGIIGAGRIATKMVAALAPLDGFEVYAIGSRDAAKAEAFAKEYDIPVSYGSYKELVSDPLVDLIYVATPHSHHYEPAMLALEHGKPVLVEKAFTANAALAERLIAFAHEKGVFITEAIWTRYLPMSHKVKELLDSGIIGEPHAITATLCYPVGYKERIFRADLCGGALLDLGVYCLNFARMYFGTDIVKTVSNCHLSPTGMDMHECISLSYADGKMANLQAGTECLNDRQGIISGTEGYIRVDNINCPEVIEVYRNYELTERILKPTDMVNGFEYQVMECKRCIQEGLIESPMMPHAETISIMKQMDDLRNEWGVRYPYDETNETSGVPFDTSKGKLYSYKDLYLGYRLGEPESYKDTYDYKVYEHYLAKGKHTGDVNESLARVLHDHSMSEAMDDFLGTFDEKDIVGIMGGHGLLRTDPEYTKVALVSKKLTESGCVMVSGGGPGAMEATHLGAWLAGRDDNAVHEAVEILSAAPSFKDELWLETAFRVMLAFPHPEYVSLGVPTWLYGHEPATPFATHIAKYFDNSTREDLILTIAKGGVIYSPGSAGTMQEIFQDAVQNHYLSFGYASPMVFLGEQFWMDEMPVYRLMQHLVEKGKYKNLLLSITDDIDQVVSTISAFRCACTEETFKRK